MKAIEIPNHTVKGEDGSPVGFKWFVGWLLTSDEQFNKDGQAIRSSFRIETALGKIPDEPAGESLDLSLEEPDYERLKRAAEAPSVGGYPARPARAVLPWVEAIANAK